jgi:hypothetical protein
MRSVAVFGLVLLVAACSGDPRSYGITGPGTQPAPVAPSGPVPDTAPIPGVSTTGSSFGPTNAPSTGSSGFWGYN